MALLLSTISTHTFFHLRPPTPNFQPHLKIPNAAQKQHTSKTKDGEESRAAFTDYQYLFQSQQKETTSSMEAKVVEGEVPLDFPKGTYYLLGPGTMTDEKGCRLNPLEGHGYIRAFEFLGEKVLFKARYVRTEAWLEERGVDGGWRFRRRGVFSLLKGGGWVSGIVKNVANTCVVVWGGRVMCMWEGGEPYLVNSTRLDTVGRFQFDQIGGACCCCGGVGHFFEWIIRPIVKMVLCGVLKMPEKRWLSHTKIDHKRKRLLLMSCNVEDLLLPYNIFTFYEYDLDFKLVQQKRIKVKDHFLIHDWGFTDEHYIFFGNRVKIGLRESLKAAVGISAMISAIQVNTNKPTTPVYIIPRFEHNNGQGYDLASSIELPSQLWLVHMGNAFSRTNDSGDTEVHIVASVCSYRWFNLEKMFGYNWRSLTLDPSMMNMNTDLAPRLVQITVNLNNKHSSVESLNKWSRPSDFPITNPIFSGNNRSSIIYAASTSGSRPSLPIFPYDTVLKLNLVNKSTTGWRAGHRSFIGEPIFVRNGPGEEDGYILVVEYAVWIKRCYLVILNPRKMTTVARIEVPPELTFPFGFHGLWHDS